ncbi:MAG: CTP synthase [Bdellovibrionales bacterium]
MHALNPFSKSPSKTAASKNTRYIFVTGGVVSSLGKGVAAASIAVVLQAHGFKVRCRKFDPYLNIDAGTLSPYRHGEVFVTDDGGESDLDLGHYERFTGVTARKSDAVTSGQVYQTVLRKERRGDYDGRDVQVIPHVTDAIKEAIQGDLSGEDFVVIEIGGTVGDIEGPAFLEAIRQMGMELSGRHEAPRCMFVHLTLLPYISAAGELKTKPTQHSVRTLQSYGIQPDLLLCRADRPISDSERQKIAQYCNLPVTRVIPALDVDTIYAVPLDYAALEVDKEILGHFGLSTKSQPNLTPWREFVQKQRSLQGDITIGLVGKYNSVRDSYKSLLEALYHGGITQQTKVNIRWIEGDDVTATNAQDVFKGCDAILVPGGFGERGTEGKIAAARYARENKVPYLGICFGLQMAVLECARNLAGIADATSSEFGPGGTPIVGLMTEWMQNNETVTRAASDDIGGTMRLGNYPCNLLRGSRAAEAYGTESIVERHRHRYEVNINYRDQLAKAGLVMSGTSPDGTLPEIMEYTAHPFFIGVQFHPELKSRPLSPHPLFVSYIAAAKRYHAGDNGTNSNTTRNGSQAA